jgi:hypothetical protein
MQTAFSASFSNHPKKVLSQSPEKVRFLVVAEPRYEAALHSLLIESASSGRPHRVEELADLEF